jgi:hypothetical protein
MTQPGLVLFNGQNDDRLCLIVPGRGEGVVAMHGSAYHGVTRNVAASRKDSHGLYMSVCIDYRRRYALQQIC